MKDKYSTKHQRNGEGERKHQQQQHLLSIRVDNTEQTMTVDM